METKIKILLIFVSVFVLMFLVSGIDYINLFHQCAEFLRWLAPKFGMTYKEINIWIFVIIEPIIFVIMLVWIIVLKIRIKKFQI